jgi:hypothetical protein
MAETTSSRLRGLVLSAVEVKELTGWSDPMVEDYLNILQSLITLADEIDTVEEGAQPKREVVRIAISPYTAGDEDEIFVDTDSIPVTINLPAGVDAKQYRIINVGTSGNNVSIVPHGAEDIGGENSPFDLFDQEVIILTFETNEGWY